MVSYILNENFIFYKPKEIVSGDFYWIKQGKHYIILVSADCTGHGVPGAFKRMLGISCLNEIVQNREQKEILEQTLKDWMGEHSQRDDILIIGVRCEVSV